MEDLKNVELPKLIDLLAEETTHYMKMVSSGATKSEFEHCQQTMKMIQREIEVRKGSASKFTKDEERKAS